MLLQVSDISKSYGVKSVLSNITMQILNRERIGLVGVNGAGKSTLLQIIAGEITPDSGTVYKAKETRIGYLAQNSGLQAGRTIDEEMRAVFSKLIAAEQELRDLEQLIATPALQADDKKYAETLERYAARSEWFREQGGFEMDTRIRSVLHGMGFGDFAPDTPVATLSGGQKTRLALARILLQAPDLLMLDEPTNYLDIATLTWLEDYLRGYAGAILVVSHDRFFLDALATGIVEIERHSAKRYTGNYSRYIEIKAAEYEAAMKQFDKQQDAIARMEQFVERNLVRASTTKRAQSRRKALEKMDRLDRPQGELKKAHFSFEIERPSGKDVLDARDLALVFPDQAQPVFQNVSLQLQRAETVALIGPNGVGKSTLLKLLVGEREASAGTLRWGSHVRIGYYDQEQTTLNPKNTVLEEVWNAYPHLEEVRIRTVLGSFLFSGEDVKKKISLLSGGEKARVSLAKLMLLQANVLILDEPTNHLDLFSKEMLESALMDYDGTLLFISHDRYFLNKMAERIVELTSSGVYHFLGNYDAMLEKKLETFELEQQEKEGAAQKARKTDLPTETSRSSTYEVEKQAKKEERARQRQLEQLEKHIAEVEEEIAALELALTDPEVYQNYQLVQEKQSRIDQLKTDLEQSLETWEQLMS
ncbi:ABC transporter ATP-binding protein [Paenibacillaceae bacterium]|nr:ABC transporter ATP-binding protein [Paenibacillaceae bacterium]